MFNFFFFMIRSPPWSTRTSTLFPYPTRFRSQAVVDRRPALGIIGGGQYARRLVEDEQPCGRRRLHRLVVDRYAFQRIEKRGRCFHRLAVDRDPAVGDHPFDLAARGNAGARKQRSEEHTSELQSLMRISYAVFCLKKKKTKKNKTQATKIKQSHIPNEQI